MRTNVGSVDSALITTMRIDVSVDMQTVVDDLESVIIYVNGRPLTRMHPSKAERLGLIRRG